MRSLTKIFMVALLAAIAFAEPYQVITGEAREIRSTSAILTGEILPGTVISSAWVNFRFGEGSEARIRQTQFSGFAGGEATTVAHRAIDLKPGTTYCYYINVDSVFSLRGTERCFTTIEEGAPFVNVGNAGNVKGVPCSRSWVTGEGFNSNSVVLVAGHPVATFFESDRKLWYQVPCEVAPEALYSIGVQSDGKLSNEVPLLPVAAMPVVLKVVDTNWNEVDAQHPLEPSNGGNYRLTVVATGLGAVGDPPRTGESARTSPASVLVAQPQVWLDSAATVEYAGLMPGQIGLYQINVSVPASAGATNNSVIIGKITLGDGSYAFFPVYLKGERR